MICKGQEALIWKTFTCINPHSLGDKQEAPFLEFPQRCLWIVNFPWTFHRRILSLRGYLYFWLFIISQRRLFSKHRPKDKNLLNVSLHFGTSSHTSNSCNIYSANSLSHLKCNCPLLKKKETHALDLHIAFICIYMHIYTHLILH